MGKENSSTAANGGKKNNNRKPFYKRKGNGEGDSNNVVTTKKTKEMKFYLHDSAARKSSESFGRIKESIIFKIQKSFEDPIHLSDLIINNKKKKFPSQKRVRLPWQKHQKILVKGLCRMKCV